MRSSFVLRGKKFSSLIGATYPSILVAVKEHLPADTFAPLSKTAYMCIGSLLYILYGTCSAFNRGFKTCVLHSCIRGKKFSSVIGATYPSILVAPKSISRQIHSLCSVRQHTLGIGSLLYILDGSYSAFNRAIKNPFLSRAFVASYFGFRRRLFSALQKKMPGPRIR